MAQGLTSVQARDYRANGCLHPLDALYHVADVGSKGLGVYAVPSRPQPHERLGHGLEVIGCKALNNALYYAGEYTYIYVHAW